MADNRTSIRIGIGHDRHRLVAGRPFVLGGVEIEHSAGPFGHSDGDVLLHAATDAVLGAAGLGDIGEWFPDTEPEWKDADSAKFLTAAITEIQSRGWSVVNADATIFLERPKLAAYKSAIRTRLAELLEIAPQAVNIKAKTGEQLGPMGRREAVEATVAVLLASEEAVSHPN